MKIIIPIILLFNFSSAVALEQCSLDEDAPIRLIRSDKHYDTYEVFGDSARILWIGISGRSFIPGYAEAARLGYEVRKKESELITCWNYRPAEYEGEKRVGAAECEVFQCNVLEPKKK